MTDFAAVAERYIGVWNERDEQARRTAVQALWAADGRYVDPLGEAVGSEAIDSVIGAVQTRFPALEFSLIGAVDAHHDQLRFQWGLGTPGAEPPIVGFDVVVLDQDGKIGSVLGFLDKVPAPQSA